MPNSKSATLLAFRARGVGRAGVAGGVRACPPREGISAPRQTALPLISDICHLEFPSVSAMLIAMTVHLDTRTLPGLRHGRRGAAGNRKRPNAERPNSCAIAKRQNGPLAKFSQNATILRRQKAGVRPNSACDYFLIDRAAQGAERRLIKENRGQQARATHKKSAKKKFPPPNNQPTRTNGHKRTKSTYEFALDCPLERRGLQVCRFEGLAAGVGVGRPTSPRPPRC
jgi:hypothetical protein